MAKKVESEKSQRETSWQNIKVDVPPLKAMWLSSSGDTSPVNYESTVVLSWKEMEDKTPTVFFILSIVIPDIGDLQLVDSGSASGEKLTKIETGGYKLVSFSAKRNQSFIFRLKKKGAEEFEKAGLLIEIPQAPPFISIHDSCAASLTEWQPVAGNSDVPLYLGLSCTEKTVKTHLPKPFSQNGSLNNTYEIVNSDTKKPVGKLIIKEKTEPLFPNGSPD